MKKKKPSTTKKKNRKRKLLSSVRKDASIFLSSEEGKIIKKDVIKMALAMGLTAASIGTAHGQTHNDGYASPGHTDTPGTHTDYADSQLTNTGGGGYHSSSHTDNTNATLGHTDQVNLGPHTDAMVHGSHGSGGWC